MAHKRSFRAVARICEPSDERYWSGPLAQLTGDFEKVRPLHLGRIQRFDRSVTEPDRFVSPTLCKSLTEMAVDLGRMVGVLIDRRGHVRHVLLGEAKRVWMPDLGRTGGGLGRTRGLRLVVATPPSPAPPVLPADLRTDLTRLRLDGLAYVESRRDQSVGVVILALPTFDIDGPVHSVERVDPGPAHLYEIDFYKEIERIDFEVARQSKEKVIKGPRWALVGVHTGRKAEDQARFDELAELAKTAGVDVVFTAVQRRRQADPGTVFGKGRLEDLILECLENDTEGMIFDSDLSPRQLMNLSRVTELKVLDRTQLILEIFAGRAASAAAKTQVEMAQLRYSLPRLVQRHSGLSRLAGGIGGRGPGESVLEVSRRRADDRLAKLQKDLDKRHRQRGLQRQQRHRGGVKKVAIVGYTNAGKSTLLNVLTGASVLAENQLFATLDTTNRKWLLRPDHAHLRPFEKEVILVDTVGFIRDLPKDLIEAFRATLEEAADADLLLHVIDDAQEGEEARIKAVHNVLEAIGCADIPRLIVRNKCDLSGNEPGRRGAHSVLVSAVADLGLEDLRSMVQDRLIGRELTIDEPSAAAEEEADDWSPLD
jgi:GTP-binding protein HflX